MESLRKATTGRIHISLDETELPWQRTRPLPPEPELERGTQCSTSTYGTPIINAKPDTNSAVKYYVLDPDIVGAAQAVT